MNGFVNAVRETEADNIVNVINLTKQQYSEHTIAILVRSRPHLTAIIPALKKAKISYRAIDIDPLASRQPIQDLLSLTCALLHPGDRVSWLSILRAPWCGLSLADLFVLAGGDAYAAIFTQMQAIELRNKLSEEGRLRIDKILAILKDKIKGRDRYPTCWVKVHSCYWVGLLI